MQPDSSPIPHTLAQWFGFALATFLAALGGWFARRNREPVELDKVRAETRQIHTSTDIAPLGITLETFREIQAVIQKAEARREEWHLKEEQLRGQIMHWRCKAEELDGELIETRDSYAQLTNRYTLKDYHLKRAMRILAEHSISFSEGDEPKE